MTNLAVLYKIEGREQDHQYWLAKARYHRQSNPYYHAWQGDEAATQGEWQAALQLFTEMACREVERDVVTFASSMRACEKARSSQYNKPLTNNRDGGKNSCLLLFPLVCLLFPFC